MSAKANPWFSMPRTNPQGKVRLFCFPHSGAAASIFYNWLDVLPGFIEVFPVQYPGRGTRVMEPLFQDLNPMVEAACQALLPYLDKPFAFFGHSLGALVGFELARILHKQAHEQGQAQSGKLAYLFVSGHTAPQLPDPEPPIHALPETEFVARLRSLNGTPEEVLQNTELRDLLLPILRADFKVSETYQYQAGVKLDCPVCACGGVQDSYVNRESLEAWREQTTGRFSVRMFPGDHFYLTSARSYLLQVIARELSPFA